MFINQMDDFFYTRCYGHLFIHLKILVQCRQVQKAHKTHSFRPKSGCDLNVMEILTKDPKKISIKRNG